MADSKIEDEPIVEFKRHQLLELPSNRRYAFEYLKIDKITNFH